jgi:CHAT domain-containing protein/cytochrome c-type biogenesis protein CcmH/NrfG
VTEAEDKHLSAEQIELLLAVQMEHQPTYPRSETFDRAKLHLETCDKCQRLVSMHREWDRVLRKIREQEPAEAGANCPPPFLLFEFAAGILSEERVESLIAHITDCDHCGPLVRDALKVISDEVSPDEQYLLNRLSSSEPAWQNKLVRQLTASSEPTTDTASHPANKLPIELSRGLSPHSLKVILRDRRPSTIFLWRVQSWRSRLVLSVAFAAALLLAIFFAVHRTAQPDKNLDVNQLLADAYSENRITDFRIAGAKYAAPSLVRGDQGEPQSLLDAKALIGRQLRAKPDDPMWLHAKGRADLLELDYGSAIKTLHRALDLQPDSAPIMIDLASAYYQSAKSNTQRQIDYGTAIEYLGRALAKSPDDPVALFNRALAEEAFHLYEPAIEDWDHYLRIDPSGSWADEAKAKLQAVREKTRSKKTSLESPHLTPSSAVADAGTLELHREINDRIEDYFQLAVKEWLPQAFPQTYRGRAARDALEALHILAKTAQDHHDDTWLSQLLAQSDSPNFPLAIARLAVAVKANESGDYAGGLRASHQARLLFHSAQSIAGELRAQTDELYSNHLLYNSRACVSLEHNLSQHLRRYKYRWLQSQVLLEAANCDYLVGNFGAARSALEYGTLSAQNYHYPGLFLRGLGFQADSAASIGDPKKGFSLASSGLDSFWSNKVDLMKGYNLYTDLDTAADDLRFAHLQVAIWRQATALIDLHSDLVLRAMAHRWYGNSAYLANLTDLAGHEFATASRLFSESPQTEATYRGQMDAEIWLAGLEARKGDFKRAGARLEAVRDKLTQTPSFATEIGFYTTQADLNLRQDDTRATESALRSAVFLAEWALRSFPSPDDRRQWSSQADRTYRTLVWWKVRQGDPKAAIELWEWYKGANYRTSAQQPEATSRLKSVAPPDARNATSIPIPSVVKDRLAKLQTQTVIAYAVFPDGVAAWMYDDRGIFFRWIDRSSEELEKLATQFQRLCSARGSDLLTLRSLGQSLYELLVAPLEQRLDSRRTLAFELDGALSLIPMEALVDRQGHYLAERTAVLVTPGLYQTLRLHPVVPITPQSKALLVSVPVAADPNLAPLSDVEREARNVADSFQSPLWLKGETASLKAIRLGLQGTAIFHFAGHAVALPERSGLLLAEQDPQTQRPVLIGAGTLAANATRQLQLAVLSACTTWPTLESRTSGTEDLTQSFLRAGVPHVLASRWNVDSKETAELMKEFYGQLMSGNSVPVSLRIAQLKLASEPASAHPYYWAAFGVQGL